MIPTRVEFEFADGMIVTFRPSRSKWISWSARVTTAEDRAAKRPGALFTNGFLQPTLIKAQRLLERMAAGERGTATDAVPPRNAG
jgi:hypothetical protein